MHIYVLRIFNLLYILNSEIFSLIWVILDRTRFFFKYGIFMLHKPYKNKNK